MKTEINPRQYDHEQLADRVVAEYQTGMGSETFWRLAPYLWRELAMTGQPVEPERLATLASTPPDKALAFRPSGTARGTGRAGQGRVAVRRHRRLDPSSGHLDQRGRCRPCQRGGLDRHDTSRPTGCDPAAGCNQQNFYRDTEAAEPWLRANPNGLFLPIADAFEVTRRAFRRMLPAGFLT